MKVFIALLCLFGTASLQENRLAYELTEVERYWTVCPPNKVFFTRNQSEPTQDIELKRTIDREHQIFASVVLTHTQSGKIIFRGESMEVCHEDSWDVHNLNNFVIRFFKVAMVPQNSWHSCPIEPEKYQIYRFIHDWIVLPEKKMPEGRYELAYTIKSADGEVVFHPLKFRFLARDITPEDRLR